MESATRIKLGYIVLEIVVALFLFTTAIIVVSQTYINLMKSSILIQNFQLAFDNFRLGAEKVWYEIKNGSDFSLTSNSLQFRNRLCQLTKIYFSGNNLIYEVLMPNGIQIVPLFDNNLVNLNVFRVYFDSPSGYGSYFKIANKIIFLNYKVDFKVKTLTIPFEITQAVAPLNSVFQNSPCQ